MQQSLLVPTRTVCGACWPAQHEWSPGVCRHQGFPGVVVVAYFFSTYPFSVVFSDLVYCFPGVFQSCLFPSFISHSFMTCYEFHLFACISLIFCSFLYNLE